MADVSLLSVWRGLFHWLVCLTAEEQSVPLLVQTFRHERPHSLVKQSASQPVVVFQYLAGLPQGVMCLVE